MTTQLGIDVFLKDKIQLLKGKRVGLLAHGASVTSDYQFTPQIFKEHPDINLIQLFAPEHGLYGTAQDMEDVDTVVDSGTGLKVVSLYGKTIDSLTPTKNVLDPIDVLVCDLQDIGSRYYTYIYTMALCLKACGKVHKPVIVLDRPNPLGGVEIEGNILKREFSSFVGMYPLPVRHGMTIGELALYFNETENLNCDLTVIPMQGWNRELFFDQTGLTFVPPSPNMPTLNTALVYPGMCLIEATELSEGRGTTKPFEWIGAPYLSAHHLAHTLNAQKLPGIKFLPFHFKPNFQKWTGKECAGVQLVVTDRRIFKPYQSGLIILKTLYDMNRENFKWRNKPYEFVTEIPAVDLLTGSSDFRTYLQNGQKLDQWIESWNNELKDFKETRNSFLLYK